MGFFDSIFGEESSSQMPDWEPTHRATLETDYDDLRSAFGRGRKDDSFGYTFWDICADDLEAQELLDEYDCAQVSNRDPRFAGSPKERGPRKDVKKTEKFFILATSSRMIDAVADEINASVFHRAKI